MANNHNQFLAFNNAISADVERDELQKNRRALRTRIKEWYSENRPNDVQPKFHQQGSYAMHTLIKLIPNEDGEAPYDLDDGVYFLVGADDRYAISTYHDHLVAAVKGHTTIEPTDKDTCVRVNYKDGHHVDLPIYTMEENDEHPMLAHKTKGWINTDPREFYQWFNGLPDNGQLRRIVKYLKAWCDYRHYVTGHKMPAGCALTMLAAKHYVKDDRDDVALKNLLVSMHEGLTKKFECLRPTYPLGEDLFENMSDTRKDNFMTELGRFAEDAKRAVNSKNPHDACLKWQKHFGDRFCCSTAKDEDEDAVKKESSGLVKNNSRFA